MDSFMHKCTAKDVDTHTQELPHTYTSMQEDLVYFLAVAI